MPTAPEFLDKFFEMTIFSLTTVSAYLRVQQITLSYLAGQRGRNLRFYTEHLSDPRYLSVHSLIRTGSLFGLQYIYGTLTNSDGKDPIDYDAIMKKSSRIFICLPRMPSPEQPLTFPKIRYCARRLSHTHGNLRPAGILSSGSG